MRQPNSDAQSRRTSDKSLSPLTFQRSPKRYIVACLGLAMFAAIASTGAILEALGYTRAAQTLAPAFTLAFVGLSVAAATIGSRRAAWIFRNEPQRSKRRADLWRTVRIALIAVACISLFYALGSLAGASLVGYRMAAVSTGPNASPQLAAYMAKVDQEIGQRATNWVITGVILLLVHVSSVWASFRIRPKIRRASGLCARCEYDLRGLASPRCPECGMPFDANDALEVSGCRDSTNQENL